MTNNIGHKPTQHIPDKDQMSIFLSLFIGLIGFWILGLGIAGLLKGTAYLLWPNRMDIYEIEGLLAYPAFLGCIGFGACIFIAAATGRKSSFTKEGKLYWIGLVFALISGISMVIAFYKI